MMKMKKTFDCVDMKHDGAERIRKKTEGMTRTQLRDYWRKRSVVLREREQHLLRQSEEALPPRKSLSE